MYKRQVLHLYGELKLSFGRPTVISKKQILIEPRVVWCCRELPDATKVRRTFISVSSRCDWPRRSRGRLISHVASLPLIYFGVESIVDAHGRTLTAAFQTLLVAGYKVFLHFSPTEDSRMCARACIPTVLSLCARHSPVLDRIQGVQQTCLSYRKGCPNRSVPNN